MTLSPLLSPRTLDQVKQTLARAKRNKADKPIASGMLLFGRLTNDARAYVLQQYPDALSYVPRGENQGVE